MLEGNKLRGYAVKVGGFGEKINLFDDFWHKLSKSTFKEEIIIDMEDGINE